MADTLTLEDKVDILTKSMGDLATVVKDVASYVYTKDEMYGEEEEYEMPEAPMEVPAEEEVMMPEEEELTFARPKRWSKKRKVSKMDDEDDMEDVMDKGHDDDDEDVADMEKMGHDDDEDDDKDMDKAVAKRRPQRKARTRKGYADTAMVAANEEDSPFDEQQNDIDGNEVQPAGDMGGDREDETFNVKFSRNEILGLKKLVASQSAGKVAKAFVPNPGNVNKGRNIQVNEESMTRDMQEAAIGKSWQELNAARYTFGV